MFADGTTGNYRLQTNSPCMDAGNNAYATGEVDLDGNPRMARLRVDIGAYECQEPGLSPFISWLLHYGLPIDGSADYIDSDDDRLSNWQEWKCATDPTNALSALRLLPPQPDGSNIIVRWQSAANVNYFLERATHLGATDIFQPLAENLAGQTQTSTYTDTNAASLAPVFYRVGCDNRGLPSHLAGCRPSVALPLSAQSLLSHAKDETAVGISFQRRVSSRILAALIFDGFSCNTSSRISSWFNSQLASLCRLIQVHKIPGPASQL